MPDLLSELRRRADEGDLTWETEPTDAEVPVVFGCAELDQLSAWVATLYVDGEEVDVGELALNVEYDFTTPLEDHGYELTLGDLVRLTDDGNGPDGYYAELFGEVARVWRFGHDPYEARLEADSIVGWLQAIPSIVPVPDMPVARVPDVEVPVAPSSFPPPPDASHRQAAAAAGPPDWLYGLPFSLLVIAVFAITRSAWLALGTGVLGAIGAAWLRRTMQGTDRP